MQSVRRYNHEKRDDEMSKMQVFLRPSVPRNISPRIVNVHGIFLLRGSPGRPSVHALCEEEWILLRKICMFCRLPVRRAERGQAPLDTMWSYRSR
jgi:hypothetical protein